MGGLGSGLQLDPSKANYNADPTVTNADRVRQSQRQSSSADLLRKSGYKKYLNEKGEEVDFRADVMARMGQTPDTLRVAQGWGDEDWKKYAESTLLPGIGVEGKSLAAKENKLPLSPDPTDDAIKAARTAAYTRLKTGKNLSSSFNTQGAMGRFDVARPVLGGY